MSIDPEELKASRQKRQQQMQNVQNYMKEQDAFDKQSAGKMGHRKVKYGSSMGEKIDGVVRGGWHVLQGNPASGEK